MVLAMESICSKTFGTAFKLHHKPWSNYGSVCSGRAYDTIIGAEFDQKPMILSEKRFNISDN